MTNIALDDEWLARLRQAGWAVLRLPEVRPQAAGGLLEHAAARLATLHAGDSASSLRVVEAVSGSPHATMSAGAVPFHNDGLYLYHPPRFVLLQCDRPAESGGDTLIVRGDDAAAALSPDVAAELRAHPVRVRLGDYAAVRRFLSLPPACGPEVLTFVDPGIATHCSLEVEGKPMPDAWVAAARDAIGRAPVVRHAWRAGDLLVLDNAAVLHGRAAYQGPRSLHRLTIGRHAASTGTGCPPRSGEAVVGI